MKESRNIQFENNSENLNLSSKLKLIKFRNTCFIPLDWINYLEITSLFLFFATITFLIPQVWYVWSTLLLLYIFNLIFNRKFKEINNHLSREYNVRFMNELAIRQPNVSKSVDLDGLFMFEYNLPKFGDKGWIKQKKYAETIIIICEENRILINSHHSTFFRLNYNTINLTNWLKLIKIKTDSI